MFELQRSLGESNDEVPGSPRPLLARLRGRRVLASQPPVELQTKVREDFTITEKAPTTRAFSWLNHLPALSYSRHKGHKTQVVV